MTSAFQSQLRSIAAKSTNELDLRARRDAHGESLIFEHKDAVKQDWETIYHICLEGFQELCLLDARLRDFEQNLFSPHARDQDREQLNHAQNEALGSVLDRCLAAIGGRALLRPGVKAVEWLVRRFRVHVYNTPAFIATFLPYHETPLFANVLAIIPANKLVSEWKFLAPYHKGSATVPRHAIVYSATHNDGFFTAFNAFVIRSCREGTSHAELLRFWGSVTVEAVSGRINQAKSGRKEVQSQRTEDALLKIVPLLVDGLDATSGPELKYTCFTIAVVLATTADLSDGVLDSLLDSIAPFASNRQVEPASVIACLNALVSQKTTPTVPRSVISALAKLDDLGKPLRAIRNVDQTPVNVFILALITSAIAGLKKKNYLHRLVFVENVLEVSSDLVESSTLSVIVAALFRTGLALKTGNSDDIQIRSRVVELLQNLNDSGPFAAVFPQAASLSGHAISEVESLICDTIEPAGPLQLAEPDEMDVDGDEKNAADAAELAETALQSIPVTFEGSSFLWPGMPETFKKLHQAFRLCHKNESSLAKFVDLAQWKEPSGAVLLLSLLLKISCGPFSTSERTAGVRAISDSIIPNRDVDFSLLLPYVTVLLSDSSQAVRRAAGAAITSMQKSLSARGETNDTVKSQEMLEKLYGSEAARRVKSAAPVQVSKLIDQVYLPALEECTLDPLQLGNILEASMVGSSRSISNGSSIGAMELKKSLRTSLFDVLTSHALATPLLRVSTGLIELLKGVEKVGSTYTSKVLTPILRDWAASSPENALQKASAEGLSLSQVDSTMVGLVNASDKEAVERVVVTLEEEKLSPRSELITAFFDRIQQIWSEMRAESQLATSTRLFDMAFSKDDTLAKGSRSVLQGVALSTEILSTLLEYASTGLTQMPKPEGPPKKKRRTSHGRESLPRETIVELDAAVVRLTLILEIIDSSQPESHPGLLAVLFDVLLTLRRVRDRSAAESPYLLNLCLGAILAIVDGARRSRKPNIDFNSIRADMVTDYVRSSENPQVQATAILLAASLASLVPDRILHNVMPIFTFMGQSILARDDEASIRVTNRAIDQIIPPLVESLKKQDASNLIASTSSLLSSFVTAYDHVPEHRRVSFYQHLLNMLGADDFVFAFVAMICVRKGVEDATLKAFLRSTVGILPANTQLRSCNQLVALAIDIFSANTQNTEPLLELSQTSSESQKQEAAAILFEAAASLLNTKSLVVQAKRLSRIEETEAEVFRDQVKSCLTQLLSYLRSYKAQHSPDLISAARKCLGATLALPGLVELIRIIPGLLSDIEVADKDLRPLMLRVVAAQLQENAPKDSKTQLAALDFLPELASIVSTSADEAYRQAALTCVDHISEAYGRKRPESIISVASVVAEGDHGMSSDDRKTQIMSLLCLASMVGVLKEAAVPVVPPAMPKLLNILVASLDAEDAALHNAALSLFAAVATHVAFMISDESLVRLLESLSRSAQVFADASALESRRDVLGLLATKLDLSTMIEAFNSAWPVITTCTDAVLESISTVSSAISRAQKSVVARASDSISTFILAALDPVDGSRTLRNAQISQSLNDLSTTFIYKLNDTSFRPVFESWVDWSTASPSTQTQRQTSLFGLFTHFFSTLKSIVTSYASYIIAPANSILQTTLDNAATVTESDIALYATTLPMLTAAMDHDADGFFTSPAQFSPLSSLLASHLALSTSRNPTLRNVAGSSLLACLIALATAVQDNPNLHQSLNSSLLALRHHSSAKARLALIEAQIALTQSEVGDEWVNNIVMSGGQSVGETMVYVNEALEDDNEEVERRVREWVNLVRDKVGPDVFSEL